MAKTITPSQGEKLNQYELLQPFQNQSAGSCRWTTGRKNGRVFFVKEFLEPVWPVRELSSPERTARQKKYCQKFEQTKKRLYLEISTASDGNLVPIEEFFRSGSKYYMTMPLVEAAQSQVKDLSFPDRLLLCKTLAHSLLCLHRKRIVHADVKASNVIFHRTATGKLTAKLIDFDCGFFEDDPPTNEEDLGGDQVYLSPEANAFILGEKAELSCKMDVFSLGLLLHEYLTDELPGFDQKEYETASEAVLNGCKLKVSENLPAKYAAMIRQMICANPRERWSMEQVFRALTEADRPAPPPKKPDPNKEFYAKLDRSNFNPSSAFYKGGDLL